MQLYISPSVQHLIALFTYFLAVKTWITHCFSLSNAGGEKDGFGYPWPFPVFALSWPGMLGRRL